MSTINFSVKPSTLMKGLLTSTRAMEVQDKRMLIIAQNMAHAGVRATNPDVDPYRAKTIGFKEAYDREMEFHYPKISKEGRDPRPFKIIYAPGDPGANEEGFVKETNVDSMIEMANMRETNLSHRANLKAYEKILSMIQETLTLLKE